LLPDILVKRLERFASTGLRDGSVAARLVFYKDAMKLIADNWVTGLGGNGWDAAYRSVQDFNYIAAYVHSAYLQIFVDNGVFAFAAYTAIIVFAVVGALRFYISVKGNMHRTFAAGLICGLLALVLHSGFDFDLTYISLVLLLWAMFAAATAGTKPPVINGREAKTRAGLFERSVISISGRPLKLILIIICSILFSSHAMYFTGAYNRQAAFEYMQQKDYKNAMVYYEEACRLDPANTGYTFELAKLYHYFGKKSAVPEYRQQWFEKAREAGEISVAGNVGHPDYMNTLVRIYLASEMPVEALLQAQKLVASQKNNAEVYELLAESYLAAYDYYTIKVMMIMPLKCLKRVLISITILIFAFGYRKSCSAGKFRGNNR
jgi:tetratricopeptide (TPR) repeat protein